ncbi:MAG: GntR family transcriptional regulator [Clostridia bacterium]|nr:GntR family transcriptional regulator [Clostridia bacterium]
MDWIFNDERPIYLQIADKIIERIVSGAYPAGSELPSVRDLAAEASVNPNTVQRAVGELQARGMVHTKSTAGSTVTDDAALICSVRDDLADKVIKTAVERLSALSYSSADAEKKIVKFLRRKESENS